MSAHESWRATPGVDSPFTAGSGIGLVIHHAYIARPELLEPLHLSLSHPFKKKQQNKNKNNNKKKKPHVAQSILKLDM